MADMHDQALEWAQANPNDPRSQHIMAKAWAAKNPNDPRAAAILEKLGAAPQAPKSAWQKFSGAVGAMADAGANAVTMGNLPSMVGALHGPEQRKQLEDSLAQGAEEHPVTSGIGRAAGTIANAGMLAGPANAMAKGAGFLGRMGVAGGQGAVTGFASKPEGEDSLANRASNALKGAGTGLALQGAGEALAKGGSLAKGVIDSTARRAARFTPGQADAYVANPGEVSDMAAMMDDPSRLPELQDQAVEALQNSRKALKLKGIGKARDLSELLKGKQVDIDPRALMGSVGEVDDVIKGNIPKHMDMPMSMKMDADVVNSQIKRPLQSAANYQKGTVLDPVQASRQADAGAKAAMARKAVEGIEGVKPLNEEMQQGVLLQEALRKGQKTNPLAFISSESPDRLATLARAEKAGGGGLLDFGNKYGAAKMMTTKDVDDALSRQALKMGGRATLLATDKAAKAADAVSGPGTLQALLSSIFQK